MTREIQLNGKRGGVALVDEVDYARLNAYRWHQGSKGYVESSFRVDGHTVTVRMHQLVLDAPPGMEVDHKSRNKLDNRRENLRPVSSASNKWNQRTEPRGRTGFLGVTHASHSPHFVARINIEGRRRNLGTFTTAEQAAAAYVRARLERDGGSVAS